MDFLSVFMHFYEGRDAFERFLATSDLFRPFFLSHFLTLSGATEGHFWTIFWTKIGPFWAAEFITPGDNPSRFWKGKKTQKRKPLLNQPFFFFVRLYAFLSVYKRLNLF